MKKILLASVFLSVSITASAQLTVKPKNGTNPSYMYVQDQIVFVTKEINLTKNTSADYEASIYLRDNGQLIQGGTGTAENTGNGHLSVQQKTEPTNAYAYYHWNSPVGNTDDNPAAGNAKFVVGSIYQPLGGPGEPPLEMGTKAKKALTTPDRNGYKNPDLTISTRWLYSKMVPSYEHEDGYKRMYVNGAIHPVDPGFGFTMKGVHDGAQPERDRNGSFSDHEEIYEFRGRPNNGTFSIPVAGPDSSRPNGIFQQQMTLAGNPYPSALDLNWVFTDPSNDKLDAFYYYDADRTIMSHFYSDKSYGFATWIPRTNVKDTRAPGEGDYVTGTYASATFYIWNKLGDNVGSGTNNTNSVQATRIAPIGQGIMFSGNSDGTVKIKNEHRRYIKQGDPNTSIFHRPDNRAGVHTSTESGDPARDEAFNETINRSSSLRLYVTFDEALTRDLVLTFNPEATDEFDRGFDGPTPGGMPSDAYFPVTRGDKMEMCVISGTNFEIDKRIPITFDLDKESIIDVRNVEEINPQHTEAYLYDIETDIYRKLIPVESNAAAFSSRLVLPAGRYEHRFFIVFQKMNIAPRPIDIETFKAQVSVFQNNPGYQLEVRNPNGYDIQSMNLFDATGKLVISERDLGDAAYHQFATSHLSDGVYFVRMTTTTNMQIDYKVVIFNK